MNLLDEGRLEIQIDIFFLIKNPSYTIWLYLWQICSNGGFDHKIADYVATYVCYWSLEIVKADGSHDLQERYLILDNIVC